MIPTGGVRPPSAGTRHRRPIGGHRGRTQRCRSASCAPAPGPPEGYASRPATRCSPMWCRPRATARRTGSSGRWTTSAPSAGRCWRSCSSGRSASAGRSFSRSSLVCWPRRRSSTPSVTRSGRPAASQPLGSNPAGHAGAGSGGSSLGVTLSSRQHGRDADHPASHRAVPAGSRHDRAIELALVLYVAYNLAATLVSVPAGHYADRRGPTRVMAAGAVAFALAYAWFAIGPSGVLALAPAFVLAGIGIGCAETAEHAAVATLAPADLRGSASGCSPRSRPRQPRRERDRGMLTRSSRRRSRSHTRARS